MSIDYNALTTLIDKSARLFRAYRQDYLTPSFSSAPKGYLVCEDSQDEYDEDDRLRFISGFPRSDISAHLKIEEPIRNREIIDLGHEIAAILRASPAFNHPKFSSILHFHDFDEVPAVGLESDNLAISRNALSPKAISSRLKQKVDRLEKLPIDGPFLSYKVGAEVIHAPNPSYALFKYALFCDPSLITQKWPDIPDISLVIDKESTYDEFLILHRTAFEEYADAPGGIAHE